MSEKNFFGGPKVLIHILLAHLQVATLIYWFDSLNLSIKTEEKKSVNNNLKKKYLEVAAQPPLHMGVEALLVGVEQQRVCPEGFLEILHQS